ncbi:AMP-binding protein [Nocardioides sp. zg-579]|uniref:AMP-binding protein n=1 Tax=Nocardioides marmotae TaxID=2663857 RepID=A0A6I3J0B4_9ACTN|nr:AMP-binding protein [Nocardioides marmotae]MCR6030844.1 AMP-binding protein [Gordonia jinghuaiqii]MTB94481.1 AMP-binding protein [Nocardioides marmotae]QKE01498.1 AMP-binding protein [Nocardioides marmotae]
MAEQRAQLPSLPRDLVAAVEHAAATWPDRPAWTFEAADGSTTRLTFAAVAERTAAYAGALRERGVGPGDRVAVLLGNEPGFPLVWLALARIGAAIVPMNVRYRSTDAQHLLDDAGVRLAVTTLEHRTVLDGLERSPEVVLVEELRPAAAYEQGPVDPAAVVNVQYTSGTTGRPKGCLLTHEYWTTLGGSMLHEFPRITADDVLLTAQPVHYVDPQWNVVAALLAGAHLVVLDGFHPSTFWQRVRAHEVTYFYCLASMPVLLHKMPPDPADRDHRVRAVQCSAIPPSLHAALEERWGVGWYEAFGMTETGADIRVTETDHDELVGTGSLGLPAGHREARVVDGELWLRGPGMMTGYLGHPSPFRDGWFPTGDLARIDEAGRVTLQGRLKDMIRRSGENVAAHEVEEVLAAHPAVRLAAVVGVPDELRGEEVMAYVVAPGLPADQAPAVLGAWCAERLAAFKVPSRWALREELPLTASHRVAKAQLR